MAAVQTGVQLLRTASLSQIMEVTASGLGGEWCSAVSARQRRGFNCRGIK